MRVVTFGEIMMRLATPGRLRFSQAKELEMTYGGGEANVAVSLANFGLDARFVTRLPKNPFGDAAIATLRGLGVDTSRIARGGERIGIYFLETGASQRPSVVVYDRAASAIAEAGPGDFDWNAIFAGADWFHFTGITPALGPRVAEAVKHACQAAKAAGLTVSCDLNYRKKLWTPAEAQATMTGLMEWVDVAIGNEEDADKVFGIRAAGADVTGGHVEAAGYAQVAQTLAERFGLRTVAITLRESHSADRNGWSAMMRHEGTVLHSPSYEIEIVDRVGGGDSFAAGLIYGLLSGKSGQEALNFAVAASCLKHSISGDFNLVSVAEVESLVGGDTSGRVQR
jgi:2-dehydro-3-deoxygluconokinase